MRTFYICNRRACGEICPNPDCCHTSRIEFAARPERGRFEKLEEDWWQIRDEGSADGRYQEKQGV